MIVGGTSVPSFTAELRPLSGSLRLGKSCTWIGVVYLGVQQVDHPFLGSFTARRCHTHPTDYSAKVLLCWCGGIIRIPRTPNIKRTSQENTRNIEILKTLKSIEGKEMETKTSEEWKSNGREEKRGEGRKESEGIRRQEGYGCTGAGLCAKMLLEDFSS